VSGRRSAWPWCGGGELGHGRVWKCLQRALHGRDVERRRRQVRAGRQSFASQFEQDVAEQHGLGVRFSDKSSD
jgi:hypothetical protein